MKDWEVPWRGTVYGKGKQHTADYPSLREAIDTTNAAAARHNTRLVCTYSDDTAIAGYIERVGTSEVLGVYGFARIH